MVSYQWFIVPVAGAGQPPDPYRPKYSDRVEGVTGNRLPNDEKFIARFYADQQILDEIAQNDDARSISDDTLRDRLNDMFDENYSLQQWEQRFMIESKQKS